MEVIYAFGVLEEVSESAGYYEEEVEGLGKTFLDKVHNAIEDVGSSLFLVEQEENPVNSFQVYET